MRSFLSKTKNISRRALFLLITVVFVSTLLFIFYRPKAKAQIFLTSGTSWTVPSDWTNSNNTIEVIGGGGGGGGGFQFPANTGGNGGGGGGAGGYSKITNATLTPGAIVTISVGAAGGGGASSTDGTAGGDTYLCNQGSNCTNISDSSVIVGAHGGAQGIAGTSTAVGTGGGGGTTGTGTITHTGGTGGNAGAITASTGGGGGGGGGGAGPNNNGNNGVTPAFNIAGAGGQGDGTNGGTAGAASGGTGGNGTEFDATHGSGGGGGGGDGAKAQAGNPGGNAGTYGAGGGGGGGNGKTTSPGGTGGSGQQGLIRITYTNVAQSNYRWRLDDAGETAGTSLVAQDTAASINSTTPVRLRVLLTDSGEVTTYNYRLEYSPYITGCYNWTAVPVTATTEHFNMYNTSNYTSGTNSTNVTAGSAVISDPSGYSFVSGKLLSTANSASVTLNGGEFTEMEYSIQANSNATYSKYCFRVTNDGTPLDNYLNYPVLNVQYTPSAPTIYSLSNGATGVPRLPIFQMRSTDQNNDYLQYVVETCPVNSFPCATGGHTYSETNTCWSQQDLQSATAFTGSSDIKVSAMAYCQLPLSDILTPNTTYYMRAKAIDPGGSNTYSAYSSTIGFTTSSLEIQINGGTTIRGGTKIGG